MIFRSVFQRLPFHALLPRTMRRRRLAIGALLALAIFAPILVEACSIPNVTIKKIAPATVNAGGVLKYTLKATNNTGDSVGRFIVVTDPIPPGLTFFPGQSSARCSKSGNKILCYGPQQLPCSAWNPWSTLGCESVIMPKQTLTFTLAFQVPQNLCGPIKNQATVGSYRGVFPTQSSNKVTTTVVCGSSSSSSSSSSSFSSSSFSSPQSSSSSSIPPPPGCIDIIKETFDPQGGILTPVTQFTFQLDGGPTVVNDGTGHAHFSNVGAPGMHTVTETIPSGWTQLSVTPAGGAVFVPNGPQCAVVTFKNQQIPPPSQPPDVIIMKEGPSTVVRGNVLSYTITVKNTGLGNASNVVVTDPIPAGVSFNAGASDSSCMQVGNNVACGLGTLSGGQTRTLTISFTVPTVEECTQTTIQNQATVGTTSQESNPENNQSGIVTTRLDCPPPVVGCIDVVKETFNSLGQPMTPVTQFTFQLDGGPTAVNDGGGHAHFVNVGAPGMHTVTETVPAGWNQLSVTPAGGIVSVQNGPQCAVVTFKNQQVPPPPPPDLIISKSGPSTVMRGNILSYTLNVTNVAATAAANVTVTDPIPSGLQFAGGSSDASCTQVGSSVACGLGTLNGGQTRTLTIAFTVPVIEACTVITVQNQATVTTTSQESTTSNNASQVVSTRIDCPPPVLGCIRVVKQTQKADGTPITPVTAFTFRLDSDGSVQNDAAGNALFTNVPVGVHVVTETVLPSGWTSYSVQPALGQVTVNQGTECAVVTFINRQIPQTPPELAITKTGPQSITRGNVISYTIGVSNSGESQAQNVVVTDPIPSGVSFNPAASDSSCTQTSGNVVCSLGALNGGQTRTITISFSVPMIDACTTTNIQNQATASTSGQESGTQSSASQIVGTRIDCPPTVSGCIRIVKETFNPQGNLLTPTAQFSFTLDGNQTSANDGGGIVTFQNVSVGTHTVTESVPQNWTQLSVTPTGGTVSVAAGTQCAAVYFKNQQTITFVQQPTPPSSTPTYTPPIYVTERPVRYDVDNCRERLTVSKTPDRSEAMVGDLVTYTIAVENDGSGPAEEVVVDDRIDTRAAVADAGGAQVHGNVLRWRIGRLERGVTRRFTYRVRLTGGLHHGDTVRNDVRVASRCEDQKASATISVIEELPQTGFLSNFLRSPSEHLRQIRHSDPMQESGGFGGIVLWLSLLAIASGIGGWIFGHRYL